MLSNNRSLFFTLFFALTLLIAFAPEAGANGVNAPAHVRQAKRMLKKRAPFPAGDSSAGPPLVIGVGGDPHESTTTSTTSATGPTAPISGGSSSTTTSTSSTETTTTSTGGTSTSTTVTGTNSTTSTSTTSTTSSTSATSTSSSTTSSTSSSTSQAIPVTPAPQISSPSTTSAGQSTLTITSSLGDTSNTAAAAKTSSASKGLSGTTLTIIIVIASCVGGAALIWTIIRKWKFRPSAEFEDRMQPIDWQPSVDHTDDGIPGSLRRATSNGSHGSFHSGSDHDIPGAARGYGGGYGATSDHGHGGRSLVSDLPTHDFTAGPAHLAPVGGYADLARGPSPQPPMQEALSRGPSVHRGYGYDTYGPRY